MPTATKHDAIALLKADHKKVKQLFDDFEKTKSQSEKKKIADQACQELRIHAVVEEEIFYPAVREALGKEEDQELLDEAEEEHRVAKTIIEELCESQSANEHFQAKFIVLAENVRHHIKEEEGEMFPEAKDTDLDFQALGEEIMKRKEELQANEDLLEEAEEKSTVKPYQELSV